MVEVTADDDNGNTPTATETINVTDVDLGTPFDRDNNEVIDFEEVSAAVLDYLDGLITFEEVSAIVFLYLEGGEGQQAATQAEGTQASAGIAKETAEGIPASAGMREEEDALSLHMKQRNASSDVPWEIHTSLGGQTRKNYEER